MDTILFNGGASGVTESALPVDLMRLKCNLVCCNEQEERSSGPNAPNYCEKVLVGNWFERRSIYRPPIDEWITVYNTHYKPHGVKDPVEDVFTVWKNKQKILEIPVPRSLSYLSLMIHSRYDNVTLTTTLRQRKCQSDVSDRPKKIHFGVACASQGVDRPPIIDGDTYLDNMTSAYDLSYRILPSDLCGPRVRVYNARKKVWVPEADLTLGYGNRTKYGLVDALKARKSNDLRSEGTSTWKSIYKNDYNASVVTAEDRNFKRFLKPHGNMNTPDLRHLGITIPFATRPPAPKPRYRSPLYEKICTRF